MYIIQERFLVVSLIVNRYVNQYEDGKKVSKQKREKNSSYNQLKCSACVSTFSNQNPQINELVAKERFTLKEKSIF